MGTPAFMGTPPADTYEARRGVPQVAQPDGWQVGTAVDALEQGETVPGCRLSALLAGEYQPGVLPGRALLLVLAHLGGPPDR